MKRIILFWALILAFHLVSGIQINEIEANPEGSDSGNEWIELYSPHEFSVEGWKIMKNDNKTQNLIGNFSGFYVLNISTQWIINSGESIYLIDANGNIVDSFVAFNDSSNDGRTWNQCNGEWIFTNGTKGNENNCVSVEANITNNTNYNSSITNSSIQNNSSPPISLSLNSPDSVNSNEEFEIELELRGLGDYSYDIKTFIIDEEIISESYNSENSIWASSFYYIENFVEGPGDSDEKVRMKISSDYVDTEGKFTIYARLRRSGSSDYIEESREIEIYYSEESILNNSTESVNSTNNTLRSSKLTGNVVYLNPNNDDSKDIKSGIIYRSRNQKIREYSAYAFAGFCVLIIAFLLIKKK